VFCDGCYLVALDGTGYFSSKTIHCASCLQKFQRNGSMTYAHQRSCLFVPPRAGGGVSRTCHLLSTT
jgi:hypothetical protein